MTTATKEEVDALCKQVHDLTEAAQKAAETQNKELEARLPGIVSEILKTHPGRTPQRKIQFADPEGMEVDEIFDRMPKELIDQHDQCILASKILGKPVTELKSWNRWSRKAGDFKKALDTATAGEGLEWIPTDFSSQLLEKVHLELKVMALFPSFVMPTPVYEFPIELGDIDTFGAAEATADTGQTKWDIGEPSDLTGKVTFTAKLHVARILTSREITEDSIIPILPLLQNRLVRGIALGREDVALNGDTAGTHEDSDVEAVARHRAKSWMGLRATALDQSYKTDLATFNLTNLRTQRAGMGIYGATPSKLAYITSIRGYVKNFLGLTEVITVDKYGAQATVLSGELAKLDGIPIIVSEKMRENLNASGVYDASTTTKTVISLVNRDGFMVGNRRNVNVQLLRELYAESGQMAMLVDERFAFRDTYPIASNHTTDLGYNIG